MAQDDLYLEFIKKLQENMSPDEAANYLAESLKAGASFLYSAIIYYLEEEDLDAVESLTDEKEQEEEMKKRFTMRTGMTPQEFVDNIRDAIAKNYMFPELSKPAAPAPPTAVAPKPL